MMNLQKLLVYYDDEDDNLFNDFAELVTQENIPVFGISGGSDDDESNRQPGQRQPNKKLNFEATHRCFHRFYFSPCRVYDELDSERRLKMSRRLFQRI